MRAPSSPCWQSDDANRPIVAAWAFRVTDPATGQRVGRFDKPVQWSVTDPRIGEGSAVYNTSAANPPVVTDNATPGTVTGTTLSHAFGGAGAGWLALGTEQAVVAPVGMPTTGNPAPATGLLLGLLGFAALLCAVAGLAVRRQGARG